MIRRNSFNIEQFRREIDQEYKESYVDILNSHRSCPRVEGRAIRKRCSPIRWGPRYDIIIKLIGYVLSNLFGAPQSTECEHQRVPIYFCACIGTHQRRSRKVKCRAIKKFQCVIECISSLRTSATIACGVPNAKGYEHRVLRLTFSLHN